MPSFVRLAFCITVLAGGSCSRTAPAPSSSLIVAHRGASHLAPENTLAAFTLAWELGADAVEGDFYLTADGQIVCRHDETTKRTAGVDRPVEEQTLAELKGLDVGAWKDARWAGERIPTLSEVLRTVPAGRRVLLEIKSDVSIVAYLVPIIEGSALELDQVMVISFDAEVIAAVERRLPAIRTSWLSGFEEGPSGQWHPTAREVVETAARIRTDGVDLEAKPEVLTKVFVRTLRSAGLEFHVWTVNDPGLARAMIDLGADSITTDRPGWLREQIEAPP